MKRMASPTSWFGLRTKSSSKRSVSPSPPSAPLSHAGLPLRAATRCRSQAAALSGRRGSPAPEQPQREDLMRTYLAWVNAHLKRRQESDKITDLAAALRDGITLLGLAEALSGREVSGACRSPAGEQEREANVAVVLSFLLAEGLEVGSVSAREIMEGNLKHLLRVIYAMACHYKAAPIQRASTADSSLGTPAVSEYASLKRQVNEFEKKLRGNALIDKYRRMSINSNILSDVETGAGGYDTDNTVCDSDGAGHSPVASIPKDNHSDKMEEPIYVNVQLCADPTRDSATADSASILRHADGSSGYSTQEVVFSRETGVKNREVHVYSEDSTDQFATVESCLDELATSLSDLTPIKQQIMQVQSALGSSSLSTDLFPEVSVLRTQLCEARARCEEQSEQLSESAQRGERLAAELCAVVQECTDLSERLTESLSIRADVLRKDYLLQNSEAENLSLRISAREKDEVIKQLEGRLLLRQELLATLESQVSELQREKRRGRVSDPQPAGPAPSDPSETQGHLSARVKEVCEVLFALRSRVGKDPASTQLIDSVETGLYAIVERLYFYAARALKRPKSDRGAQSPRGRGRGSSCNRPASGHKPECTDLDPSQLVVFDICQTPEGPQRQTQLLYYVDKQETPCRVGIQKPASDVKLSDVKCQINRAGSFSYHFKVEDPDFGALKEEISGDTDRVPVYKKNTVVVYLESHDV